MTYTPTQIAQAKSGDPFVFDFAHADVAQTFTFSSGNWGLYKASGLAVGEKISPNFNDDGTTQAGTFTASVTLLHLAAYNSAHIVWDGTGFTVEYSLDGGTTWVAISEYATVALVKANDPDLDIRVTFTAGGATDASLNSLTVYVFTEGKVRSLSGARTATIGHGIISDAGLADTDGITISAVDAGEATVTTAAVEIYGSVGALASTNTVFSSSAASFTYDSTGHPTATGCSVYINGAETEFAPSIVSTSVPYHFLIVLDTPVNEEFTIGSNMTLTHLAAYPETFTPSEALNLYTSVVHGMPAIVINDAATITVTEASPAIDIYAYAWSVVSGDTQ